MNVEMIYSRVSKIALLTLILLLTGCTGLSNHGEKKTETPDIEPLTPKQVIEYIEIFYMQCDKTNEQILAGEGYTLSATDKTEDLLFRLNFFTGGLYYDGIFDRQLSLDLINNSVASEAFLDDYYRAINVKKMYTDHLTAHWLTYNPFIRIELVESYPAEIYWFYKNIPEEILRRVYIEKDGVTLPQYLDLIQIFNLKSRQYYTQVRTSSQIV